MEQLSLSATERVKLISAAYLEQVLPVIGAKALNREENLPAATEVAKFFARNALKADPSKTAERFVIQINIGNESKTYDKPLVASASNSELPEHKTPITIENKNQQTSLRKAQSTFLDFQVRLF